MGSASEFEDKSIVRPSAFACWARKFRAATPWPPGMFCTTMFGLPGRYLVKNFANRRAAMSVLPPVVVGKIILIDLPSKETFSWAKAGTARATQAVTASIADRDGIRIRWLRSSIFRFNPILKEGPRDIQGAPNVAASLRC